MTTEVDEHIREMDSIIEGLTTGNREMDLQMIEFLIALDERVSSLLKAQSDRVDRKLFDELHERAKELSFENRDLGSTLSEREVRITELLEKEEHLRKEIAAREEDVRDALAQGNSWKEAFHHVREQILAMAREQGSGNALLREHLQNAQSALEQEEVEEEVSLPDLEWTPSSEKSSFEDEVEDEISQEDEEEQVDSTFGDSLDLSDDDIDFRKEFEEFLKNDADSGTESGFSGKPASQA